VIDPRGLGFPRNVGRHALEPEPPEPLTPPPKASGLPRLRKPAPAATAAPAEGRSIPAPFAGLPLIDGAGDIPFQ
jgi:hypothetical protein